MGEKERRDNVTILCHTCAIKQHHNLHDRESLVLSLSYTSGNFSLQNLACIFQRWASSNALGLHEQASWKRTHLVSFVELSYIYSSSASVAWQSLLLTLISVDGHLHSPLIKPCQCETFLPFCLLYIYPYHHTLFHPQCYFHLLRSCIARGFKKLKRVKKYESIARVVIGVVHDGSILCNENEAWPNYMTLQG